MKNQQVGDAIRERRTALRLSAREAARRADISATTWSDLEAGKHPPSAATQRGVAEALSWPVTWIEMVEAGITPVSLEGAKVLTAAEIQAQLDAAVRRIAALEDAVRVLTQGTLPILIQVETGGDPEPRPAQHATRSVR